MAIANRGPRAHKLDLPKLGTVNVYAGVRVGRALDEVQQDLSLYQGVKLLQVIEAVYEQGRRDGRAQVFAAVGELEERKDLQHRRPGRPKGPARKRTTTAGRAGRK